LATKKNCSSWAEPGPALNSQSLLSNNTVTPQ
jgi:hypothetical protein